MPFYRRKLQTVNNITEEITQQYFTPTVLLQKESFQFNLNNLQGLLNFNHQGEGMLINVGVSVPCRLRLYSNANFRDADILRTVNQSLPENHGLLYEAIFDNFLNLPVLPIASGNLSEVAYSINVSIVCSIQIIKITNN
jgi:hypothetical protein